MVGVIEVKPGDGGDGRGIRFVLQFAPVVERAGEAQIVLRGVGGVVVAKRLCDLVEHVEFGADAAVVPVALLNESGAGCGNAAVRW